MNPPDGQLAGGRVLGLYDGGEPPPSLVESCARQGLDVLPYVECMPFGQVPQILLAPASQWRLALGLSASFSGFVETVAGQATSPDVWRECAEAAAMGGIGVSLTSATAYSHDLPCPFVAAIGRRFPDATCLPALELALYESLANAIIHGNLGIDSSLRDSAEGLRDYRVALAHALTDPHRATRRVIVTCLPRGEMLRLTVRDHGGGWDVAGKLGGAATAEAKSGRGLDLIRQAALAVRAEDGGRLLIMDFRRHAP